MSNVAQTELERSLNATLRRVREAEDAVTVANKRLASVMEHYECKMNGPERVSRIERDLLTVSQALADLQTALVDEGTERGPLSPRLDAALKASWAQWSPSDEDPTINLRAK